MQESRESRGWSAHHKPLLLFADLTHACSRSAMALMAFSVGMACFWRYAHRWRFEAMRW